ncbi:alpha/beta hydrolase [Cohnella sp. GCM10020058]|uniref:alpha/beta hydrolase n=1 Tax=Cohnella sp. GCM10020058 TaxID=3317330 RepID=UPI003632A082
MPLQAAILTVEGFRASRLDNERRLFVYLPPGYEGEAAKRYPVLYMHAGQRAFDPAARGTESWRIHRAADRLIGDGLMDGIIIVAIAHVRPAEANEYYHFKAPAEEADVVRCAGLDYEDFVVNEVKPYIDARFRTLPDPVNTGLLGSSAGGLCTYHMGFRHPDVFGKLMMLSPYFVKAQLDDSTPSGLREECLYKPYRGRYPVKVWMDIGDAEGLFLPRHVRDVAVDLIGEGFRYGEELAFLEQPDAAHQETDWGDRAHIPLLFMFGRTGAPASLELRGRTEIGLTGGCRTHVNAVLRYDSGFALSVLNGKYRVGDPSVLKALPDGTLIPLSPGTTTLTLSTGGLVATGVYTVVPALSDRVVVEMTADVPPEASPPAAIYGGMGMRLAHRGGNRYAGRFRVPRDTGFRFRFTKGFRKFETDPAGGVMPNRTFRASDDLSLHYEVARWEDAPSQAAEGRGHADSTI